MWEETPNRTYISIITAEPPETLTVMNLAKCNSAKSNLRLRKCICKTAKLYCAALFAC